ncbi:ComEC/Rec2 family competence protein [Pseudotamlana agarivorans]|uniref:ComEC/Rec2 family competence protein n=1 Tax=Pseudotamlana agarivorans TaxID=481183 RepID=UPI00082FCBD3|nr:ComEC/Rec2 family competence protein [Tamlana agarivorans]
MKLLNFTIIKLLICLVTGILIGYYFDIKFLYLIIISTVVFIGTFTTYYRAKRQFIKTIWFGVFSFLSMINIGILTTHFHEEKNFSNHYSHNITSNSDSIPTITFRVKEILKPSVYYDKFIVDILKLDQKKVVGKTLLNIKKDSIASEVNIDDILVGRTSFETIPKPLNPHQFNYSRYLSRQYIYHQITLNPSELLKGIPSKPTIYGISENIRKHINTSLKCYNFKHEELGIINALFLGQRQSISKEVYNQYTNAGAVHILAVSGLHVGIILMLFNFILSPIERFRNGKLIKTFLLVSLLWCFAVIAGLSASVTRAVTMFSIISIAMNLKRLTNIYNTLAISMFVLLLFKPLYLFDVGFQLSYITVLAIVSIDPYLYKLWQPKNKLIAIYWHTLTVTVAAQIGILPLSLYYFHQFPGLFFITNLVIIPILGGILGLGVVVILLASFKILPHFIAVLFGKTISLMNAFIAWISHQDVFVFHDIPFGWSHVIASYLIICTGFIFLLKKHYKSVLALLVAIILIQITWIYTKLDAVSNEFVIFHKNRHSLISHTQKRHIFIAHDLDSLAAKKDQTITNYVLGNHTNKVRNEPLKPVYQFNDKLLFVIDSLGVYDIKQSHPEYILLRQSPKINLNRLIETLSPKYIIADGSNYKSYVNQWEMICKKHKLPFHDTGKKGAFILEY